MVKTKKEKKVTTPKKYTIVIHLNDTKFTKKTNNIKEALLSVKPELLFTDVNIEVKKGEEKIERHLNLRQGKTIFINEDFMDIFIINLMLE